MLELGSPLKVRDSSGASFTAVVEMSLATVAVGSIPPGCDAMIRVLFQCKECQEVIVGIGQCTGTLRTARQECTGGNKKLRLFPADELRSGVVSVAMRFPGDSPEKD